MNIIYYEVVRELPFAKIGDQCNVLTDDEVGVNGVRFPIKYTNSDFFRPITLEEHQSNIKKNFIKFIMEKQGVNEDEAEKLSKDFWKLK